MRTPSLSRRVLCVLALSIMSRALAAQVHVGQTDTFQNGTTQNWATGLLGAPNPVPPQNAPSGGPAGIGDNFLLLQSIGGVGAGSRLTVVNFGGQWAGDYLTAGINAIAFDAINLGSTPLSLRLLFENPSFTAPPTLQAASTDPVFLPVGSGWTTLVFPLFGTGGLSMVNGESLTALLSETTAIRIYNSPSFSDVGPPVVARLGVDNITALSTPEPATIVLVAAGLCVVLVIGRRASARKRPA